MSDIRGERPFFAVFKSDIERLLNDPDWLQNYIDGVGMLHHYPYDTDEPAIFALMEYSAAEVIQQASSKGMEDCFAAPTVLECENNPAFCPTPRSTGHGYVVDLRPTDCIVSGIREILHPRIDYSWKHVKKLGKWAGASIPNVEAAGEHHLDFLRRVSGRENFGTIEEGS